MVAVGCLAERYGKDLAESLPEADAVLGFDDYPDIADRLRSVARGRAAPPAHTAGPAQAAAHQPGRASRRRGAGSPRSSAGRIVDRGPMAPLKLASGCDRRCTFCAIPRFRGSFVSRRPGDVLAEARWLAEEGARELFLVSENSTSYGKDLGDLRLLETLLPELAAVDGVERVRVSYLQPAETRPGLLEAIATTPGVAAVLRPVLPARERTGAAPDAPLRRRRSASSTCSSRVRGLAPEAGVRSNVIVGFPGETDDDLEVLCDFLVAARLDVTGVFGYSDEDGTEAATYADKLTRTRSRPASTRSPRWSRSSPPSAPRTGSASASRCSSSRVEDGGRRRAGPPTRGPRSTAPSTLPGRGLQVGDLVPAVVIDGRRRRPRGPSRRGAAR